MQLLLKDGAWFTIHLHVTKHLQHSTAHVFMMHLGYLITKIIIIIIINLASPLSHPHRAASPNPNQSSLGAVQQTHTDTFFLLLYIQPLFKITIHFLLRVG